MKTEVESELVERLHKTRKYANTCEDTLVRVARWALARHDSPKTALKAAKRKLHQVYGAYVGQADAGRIDWLVGAMPTPGSPQRIETACREILGWHASTRERLSMVEDVYARVFSEIGTPRSILDLACGLNPFALPWMGLPEDAHYHAFDIDRALIAAINRFLGQIGRAGSAHCQDILVAVPQEEADVALLLKTVPCLEQQEKGASARVLRQLRVRHAVVSFPTRSLGGRDKGMLDHYDGFMQRLLDELGRASRRIAFTTEVFYVIELRPLRD